MGGTSMAAPLVAGGAAVVRDFYQKSRGHQASAALVKATLINSAVDLLDENNDGVFDNANPIPNMHEGWGRVDLVQRHRRQPPVRRRDVAALDRHERDVHVRRSPPPGVPFKVDAGVDRLSVVAVGRGQSRQRSRSDGRRARTARPTRATRSPADGRWPAARPIA